MQDNADIDAAFVQHISVTTQHFAEVTARVASEPPPPPGRPLSSLHAHVDGVKQELSGLHSQAEFKIVSFFQQTEYFQSETEQSLGKVHTPVSGLELKIDALLSPRKLHPLLEEKDLKKDRPKNHFFFRNLQHT